MAEELNKFITLSGTFNYTIDFIRARSYSGKKSGKLNLEVFNKSLYSNKNILLI